MCRPTVIFDTNRFCVKLADIIYLSDYSFLGWGELLSDVENYIESIQTENLIRMRIEKNGHFYIDIDEKLYVFITDRFSVLEKDTIEDIIYQVQEHVISNIEDYIDISCDCDKYD